MLKKTKTVTTSKGDIEIARGDLINPGVVSYEFSRQEDGSTTYSYTLDNSEVYILKLGEQADVVRGEKRITTQPTNWFPFSSGWNAQAKAETSKRANFTLNCPRRPGLQPIFMHGDANGVLAAMNGGPAPSFPRNMGTVDNIAILKVAKITSNSVKQFVIGPTFKATDTDDDVIKRVRQWIKYEFTFLTPLVSCNDPASTLPALQPSTQLEQDIVTCLQAVLK